MKGLRLRDCYCGLVYGRLRFELLGENDQLGTWAWTWRGSQVQA